MKSEALPEHVRARDPRVRAYPFPYTAWLALSSDPDNTVPRDWKELDRTIWQEMGLPFADSFFIRSYNQLQPQQVDLHTFPEMLEAHAHDTMHTWGDFMFGGQRGFDRQDAVDHLEVMRRSGITPRVWVDHSLFIGNLLHNHRYGGIPDFKDASGYTYPNPLYSLDLIRAAGVRYFWDGTITGVLGQDRQLSLRQYHLERTGSNRRGTLDWMKHKMGDALGLGKAFREQFQGNHAYRTHAFPDGSKGYVFPRHGRWELADIRGLGYLLAPERLHRLVETGGVCIAYTHLGKRNITDAQEDHHIPQRTRQALEALRTLFDQGRLMLSPVSTLLDHLVLRDHVSLDGEVIRFKADGIAFDRITGKELAGQRFSFLGSPAKNLRVLGTHGPVEHSLVVHNPTTYTIQFNRP